jgi:hypothetical protein
MRECAHFGERPASEQFDCRPCSEGEDREGTRIIGGINRVMRTIDLFEPDAEL